MISNSDLRCGIRRAGVACRELLRELQALRLGIISGVTQEVRPQLEALRTGLVRDIVTALSPKKTHHRPDLRKQAIAKQIQENPKITNWEICARWISLQKGLPITPHHLRGIVDRGTMHIIVLTTGCIPTSAPCGKLSD